MVAPHPCWARDSRSASSSLEVPPQHATPEESKPPRVHSVGAGRCVASTRTRPSRCAVRDGQAYGTCTCVYIYALARALHVCAQLARLAILSRGTEGFRTIHETRADGIGQRQGRTLSRQSLKHSVTASLHCVQLCACLCVRARVTCSRTRTGPKPRPCGIGSALCFSGHAHRRRHCFRAALAHIKVESLPPAETRPQHRHASV